MIVRHTRVAGPLTFMMAALAAACVGACSGSSTSVGGAASDGGGGIDATSDAGGALDAGGGSDAANDDTGIPPDPTDGTPTRQACTNGFGSGLSSTYGRLDGYLVAMVPPGQHGCNGDSDHLHLQVKMSGAIYDVAVTMTSQQSGGGTNDVFTMERDMALGGAAWSEGWHTGESLDYVKLGLRSTDFAPLALTQLAQKIEGELANANHVSVFATGYGPNGCHLVHRNNGRDGAIVIHPLSPTPHFVFFHFATQSF